MYQYIAVTDKGITRGNNEDNLLVCQIAQENLGKANLTSDQLYHNHKNHLIAAIADGVGGLTIGERASKLTVDTFVESISESLIKRNFSGEMTSDDTIYNILMDAAREANSKIKCSLLDAGSTLTACLLLDDGHAYVISIGDSRAYIIGAGEEIYQITEDQSIAWRDFIKTEMPILYERLGECLKKENKHKTIKFLYRQFLINKRSYINNHDKSHVIWNVLGYYANIGAPSLHKLYMDDKDILLLCSDGLTDELDDPTILEIISKSHTSKKDFLDEVKRKLIEEAKRAGGHDNISFILIKKDGKIKYHRSLLTN